MYVNYNGVDEKTQNTISGAIRFAEFATSTMCVRCGVIVTGKLFLGYKIGRAHV